jgi:hypothetical protein
MGAEQVRVKPDAANPLGYKPSVLPRGHASFLSTSDGEQKLARVLADRPDVVVNGLARLFGQLKPDRSACLFLADGRPIDGIAIRRNIFDLESDDIAASQLAVDRQIEHRQIARSMLDLELGADRPDVFLSKRWLGSYEFPFIPGVRLGAGSAELASSCMVVLLGYRGGRPRISSASS